MDLLIVGLEDQSLLDAFPGTIYRAASKEDAEILAAQKRFDGCFLWDGIAQWPELAEYLIQAHGCAVTLFGYAPDYAKASKAMECGCVRYIRIPAGDVTVKEAWKAMAAAAERREQQRLLERGNQFWMENRDMIQEYWWRNYLQVPPLDQTELLHRAECCDIDVSGNFLPVYFRYHPGTPDRLTHRREHADPTAKRREQQSEETIKELACAQCFTTFFQVTAVTLAHNTLLLLLKYEATEVPKAEAISGCRRMSEECKKRRWNTASLIGTPSNIESLYINLQALEHTGQNIVYLDGQVLTEPPAAHQIAALPQLSMDKLFLLLDSGMYQEAVQEIRAFLYHPDVIPMVDSYYLENFKHQLLDGLRDIGVVRKSNKDLMQSIPAHMIRYASETVQDLLSLVEEITVQLKALEVAQYTQKHLADELKSYIQDHIESELTRSSIAKHFYISADYLDRIIKKECGQTVTGYVLEIRMELAELLLRGSELSISQIASKVGYVNFSHFSNAFKKRTGMTPNGYRKQYYRPER